MAGASIVSGLFGLSPSQVEQQRMQQMDANALATAQIDPLVRSQYRFGQVGGMLGSGVANAMGLQDPAQVEAQKQEELMKQVDFRTVEGVMAGAKLAQDRGDYRTAAKLVELARAMKNEEVNNQFKNAQAVGQLAPKPEKGDWIELSTSDEGGSRYANMYSPSLGQHRRIRIGVTPEGNKKGGGVAASAQLSGQLENLNKAMADVLGVEVSQLPEATQIGNKKSIDRLDIAAGNIDKYIPDFLSSQEKVNIRSHIQRMKDIAQLTNLASLRAQGIAVGTMTEKEWPKFQSAIANIDLSLDGKELLRQFNDVYSKYQAAIKAIEIDSKSGNADGTIQSNNANPFAAELARRRGGK